MVDSSRINLQPFTPRIVALMRFELAVKLFCSGNPLEPDFLSFMLKLRRMILLLKIKKIGLQIDILFLSSSITKV